MFIIHLLVFSDDFFVIFPAAAEFEDAVVESWGVEGSLVALNTAVLVHIEIVVASLSLVVKLWDSEEVSVTFSSDGSELLWWLDDFENGSGDEIDWLVALWDLVGGVVDGFVPAATSNGDTLEFWNTGEATISSLVEESFDGGVGVDRGESGKWVLNRSSVDDGVELKTLKMVKLKINGELVTISEKSWALSWRSKGCVPESFFSLILRFDHFHQFSRNSERSHVWQSNVHSVASCSIRKVCRFSVGINHQILTSKVINCSASTKLNQGPLCISSDGVSVAHFQFSDGRCLDVLRLDWSSNLKNVNHLYI